jgi:hypothetical protein
LAISLLSIKASLKGGSELMNKMFATLATLVLALTMGVPTLATAQEGQKAPATQSKAPAPKSSKKSTKKHTKQASTTKEAKPATTASAAAPKQ